jgi:hypothetical protein
MEFVSIQTGLFNRLIVCYILIIGLNYAKSECLLMTNCNPSGPLGKLFQDGVLNDVICSSASVVAIMDTK